MAAIHILQTQNASHFKDQKVRFDLILLGLGDNPHTASLVPYSLVLADKSASIRAVFLEQQTFFSGSL